jgi:ectoine hydroxylase-related dioxygenase (phytanoyl-CoA dioxygenase family)
MSTEQTTAIEHVAEFDEVGYTIFRDVLDQGLLEETNDHVEWLQKRHPDVRPEQLGHVYLRDDPFWLRLVSDDRLLDIAELFIGPDIALFASHYISKPPFSGQPVLWHQDGSYWPLEPMEVVSLWLAVDDSNLDNGCMKVIPRSHKGQLHGVHANTELESVLGSETDSEVDESAAVPLILAAGDVEVHHPMIMHASDANQSEHRRCGLTIRYIPSSTRIIADEVPFPSAFHLRGAPGTNRYQERPVFDPARHFTFRDQEAWA